MCPAGTGSEMKTYSGMTAIMLAVALQAAPIHLAIEKGDAASVQTMISEGADVNEYDEEQKTPLMSAVLDEKVHIAALLVQNGADVNMKMPGGESPLMWASFFGNVKLMRLLIDGGAKVGAKDAKGNTALHAAVRSGRAEAVRLLLAHKAYVNALNDAGETPLHVAARTGDEDVVWPLIEAGARNLKNKAGQTPADIAYDEDNDRVSLIIRKKAK